MVREILEAGNRVWVGQFRDRNAYRASKDPNEMPYFASAA